MTGIKEMYLMFKDERILWIENSINGEVKVFNECKLPMKLRGNLYSEVKIEDSGLKEAVRLFGHNRAVITSWLSSRVLSIDREHAKKILNVYGFSQAQTDDVKAKICLTCRGISVLDCYWICGDKEDKRWKDMDLKSNKLCDIMFHVALKGTSLSFQNKDFFTPELSTYGAYAKAWRREADGLYLYKAGFHGDLEAKIEASVSNILDCFNINHLKYELAYEGDLLCTKCKCMTTDKYSIVTAEEVEAYYNRVGKRFDTLLFQTFQQDYLLMCQIDYLINNQDRHGQNWGFYYDNDSFELIGLHPLYDHNNSFDEATLNQDTRYIAFNGKTMFEAASYGFKRYPIQVIKPISKKLFVKPSYYMMFRDRLKKLGVLCKFKRDGVYPIG